MPAAYSGVYRSTAASTAAQPGGVGRDELAIDPALRDHHVQHAVEDADVAARPHGNEQVGRSRDRRHARVDDDQPPAILAGLPEVVGRDRRALGDVRAGDENHRRLRDVGPRVGGAVDAQDLLRGRRGRHHAQSAVVVDVGRTQRDAREFPHQIRLLVGERRAGQDGERVPPVRGLDPLHLASRAVQRGVPVDRTKPVRLVAHQRCPQPIGMLVLQVALHPLGAELAAIEGKLLPRLEADNALVLDLELDAALLPAETAVRRDDAIGLAAGRPAAGGLVARMRSEIPDEVRNRRGQSGHQAPRLQSSSCVTARFFRRHRGQTSW